MGDVLAMLLQTANQGGGAGGEAEVMWAGHPAQIGTLTSGEAPPPLPIPTHPSPPSVDNVPSIIKHHTKKSFSLSDVDVSDVCWGAGQVHVLVQAFGFCCAAVLLSLPQAGLQQRLDLLLA